MSETSSQVHAEHHDTQSIQSVTLTNAGHANTTQSTQQQQQQQQQQRSLSQAERSERSGRSGGRQVIQRSSSSTSSSDASDTRDNRHVNGATTFGTNQGGFQNTSHSHTNASGSQGSFVSGERRQGRFRRQVIRLPDQGQGQVRQVRQRLPTPEPDTIERVYIQRTAAEIVEEITEIPMTPPPQIKERTVVEPAGPAQVVKRVIRVPPRGGQYQQQQQQQYQQGQVQTNIQGSSVSVGHESFTQNQQVNGVFNYPQQQQHQQQQPFVPQVNSGVYPGQATTFPYPVNNTGAAFPSQPVQPPVGCHPAFCFYV